MHFDEWISNKNKEKKHTSYVENQRKTIEYKMNAHV